MKGGRRKRKMEGRGKVDHPDTVAVTPADLSHLGAPPSLAPDPQTHSSCWLLLHHLQLFFMEVSLSSV